MPTTVFIRKTPGGFVHIDGDYDALPMGKTLKAEITAPARSSNQNRWFHKVQDTLFDMQETWPTIGLFKKAIKRALGLCDVHEVAGKPYFEYHSTAFHKMDQVEFNQFLDRFVKLVCERICLQMSEAEIWEIMRLLDADTGVLGERSLDSNDKIERRA